MSRFTYFTYALCCWASCFFPTNINAQSSSGGPNIGAGEILLDHFTVNNGPQFAILMGQAAANLDQYRNGPFDNPNNSCTNWVNGNAGSSNSHYVEGWSIPYRCVMTDLPVNTSFTITFGYDIKHSDKHALDYLTHYDYMLPHGVCDHDTPECLNPKAGVSGLTSTTTTFAIPAPSSAGSPVPGQPTNSFNAHPATFMTLYGGTITNIQYNTQGDLNANQSETTIDVTITVDGSKAVLAWGGHIASRMDWGFIAGTPRSAGNISGSPYHMRLKDWTLNNLGNQDRSLSGAAVAPICDLTGPVNGCSGGTNQFCVTNVSGQTYQWSVTGNGTISGSSTGNCVNIVAGNAGTYTVSVEISSGSNGLCVGCSQEVEVQGGTGCNITGDSQTCPGATEQFCGPAGASSYSWTVSGNGSISGPSNQQCVNVVAGNNCNNSYTVSLTVNDGSCNSTCNKIVQVSDNVPPVITFCPPGAALGCNPAGVPAAGAATATDNCGTPTISSSLGSITSNGCSRTQIRTYTATDACGNTATCTQVFTWTADVTSPTFTFCPPGSDLGCNPAGVPAPGAATATDACGSPTITSSLGSVSSNGCQRSQTRTYTATDGCGNTATCTQVFTWTVDVTPPTFTFCPPGSELGCNPAGVPAPGAATATDACGTPTITSSLGSVSSNGCLRSQTRTYTATDACGNTATCTQVFTWTADVTPPTFTFCPPGSDLGCNPDGGIPAPGAATATDACGTPTITSSLGSVSSNGCLRTQVRTYKATDGCGNTATCTQVFTWTMDSTSPTFTFCPPGSDLGCNPAGIPAPGAATATDACGTPTITSSLGTVSSNGCLRSQTRTYTATDACGNTATCTQVFTWTSDVTPPTFTFCPPGSDLGCNPAGVPAPGTATATDACGTPTITSSLGSVSSNGCLRSQTRTYTATDACGNTATCTQVFTWTADVTPPTFTFCPPGSDLGCNPVGGVPAPGAATATDACGTPTITSSLGSVSSNGCLRSQTRTYTATDACGNTATCTQVFTWTMDSTPPTFTFCPPGGDLGCNPAGIPAPGAATATDACGTPTITSSLGTVSSNGCQRSQTRTYTATDACGNTATCTQVFTWTSDVTPPTFTFCPPGSNLGCNPTGVPAPGAATATDACGTPTITSSLGAINSDGCLRSQTRTYLATDACGNTATCTQVFTWTADVTPPTFTFCPPGSNLGCNPTGVPAPGAATATDACGTPTITSSLGPISSDGCLRIQTRTYTATDGCGNTATCTQVFTWTMDSTPPTFTFCPPGGNLGCNPAGLPAPGAATATDACGTPTITSSLGTITSDGCLRFQTRTYTATDGCGNTATCTQVFSWTSDVTPPTFTFCPPGSNLGCNPTGVPAPGAATATDACGTPTITSSLGTISSDGCLRSQTRTYVATDGCGNTATCLQVFTWTVDVTPPTFTFCPPGSNLGCNPTGVPAPGAATATDACGTPTITSSLGPITSDGCLRTQTRTYTATDGCNNTSTCTQVFTWTVDVTPPTFTFCPPGSNLGCNPTGVPAPGAATATDACGTPTITSSLGPISSDGCLRIQTRTYTATDGCGNTATCTQVFTWTADVTPPTFTFCPPGSNLGCNPTGVPAPGAATATDACGTPTITSSLGTISSDGCLRIQTRTYTATDGCGNTATCTQVFTWTSDVTPPTFTFCPPGSNLGCNPTGVPAPGAATATDACGTPTITSSLGPITSDGCLRTQTRTYTATDGCNNTATCTQVFTWTVDVTPPTFTFCPPGSNLGCNPTGVPAPGAATATDACGTPTITSSLGTITSDGCLRTQTRTYTATDGCNNTATCTQVFTWTVDLTPPSITCPANVSVSCSGDVPAVNINAVSASDGCGGVSITHVGDVISSQTCANRFTVTRTYRATDACQNTATCSQTITVNDQTPPSLTCPANLTVTCASQVPAANVNSVTGVSDNCGGTVTVTHVGDVISGQTCANRFTLTRTYRATDVCGNSATCTQIITVIDNTPPTLSCPANVTVTCAAQVPPVNIGSVTGASDNCGGTVTITHVGDVITGQTCTNRFTVTRTYRATDVCGNSATCTQVITVFDNVAPSIVCPNNVTVQCANQVPAPAPGTVSASDNCAGSVTVTFVNDVISGQTCANRFTVTRTYRATDACGNSATCTQRITVYDDTKPVLNGLPPVLQTIECGLPTPPPVVTATDNCSGTVNVVFTEWTTHDPGSCINNYNIMRKWSATDACGNAITYTAKIRVVDTTPPVFTEVPEDVVNGDCLDGLLDHEPIPIDGCGEAQIRKYKQTITCEPGILYVTRRWTAFDFCENSSTVVQTVSAIDTVPPRPMDVPADITINVGDPLPPLPDPPVWGCDLCYLVLEVDVTYQQQVFPDKVLRIWNFCDCASNCIADTQVITIVTNKPPVFINLPSATLNGGVDCTQFYHLMDQVKAIDPTNSAPLPVESTDSIGYDQCGNQYYVYVTFKATDAEGASSTTTIPILVTDENCVTVNYCFTGTQNSTQEWIQRVQFGSMTNTSGAAPYSNFTSPPIKVVAGSTYPVSLQPGFQAGSKTETWVIWLDLNRDGVFDNLKERFNMGASTGTVTGSVHIPITAKTGNIRMRVAMVRGTINNACELFAFGEIEDYTLDVSGPDCMPSACTPSFNPLVQLWEYIYKVQLGTMINNSAASRYSDFRNQTATQVERGHSYSLKTYSASKAGFTGNHYWDVYADFNRDGDFADANELVGSQAVLTSQAAFTLNVPANAVPGVTTLRIVLSRDQSSNDCQLNGYGETEDYSIYIKTTSSDSNLVAPQADERFVVSDGQKGEMQWTLVPNPATDQVVLQYVASAGQTASIQLMDLTGRVVLEQKADVVAGTNNISLQIGQLQAGVYSVLLQSADGIGQKLLVVVR